LSSDQPIGIGFVGAGWIGSMFLKHLLAHPHVQVRGLHQRREATAHAVLDDLGLDRALFRPSFDELIADPAVHGVFLCGPNMTHGPQSIAALEAGKHVFCEKPIATSVEDYQRQIELAQANPRLVTLVDYMLHFHPFEQRLQQMVRNNAFGQITQIQVNYRHPVNIAGDKAWKLSKEQMGDALGMAIIHSLYVMIATKAAQARPARVYATSMPAQVRPFEPDPIWNIHVTFDDGACGFCFGNIDSANGYDALHSVSGTEGALVHDSLTDPSHKVRFWSSATDQKWIYPLDRQRCEAEGFGDLAWPEGTPTPDSGDVIHHQTADAATHFIDCIRQQEDSPLSFQNTRVVTELGWATQMSAKLGQPVDLPIDLDQARTILQ
jgi:predicted dehydrogenase